LLDRSFLQELKRRRKANSRLIFVGSSQEVSSGSAQNPHVPLDSAIDLEVILHGVPPDVRFALLLRYSRSQWSEVAAVLGTTEAAVRLRCKRALNKIRQKLEGKNHET
jgi:DNA-directed RNA polymerase specialized sigma24 family protein